MIPHTAPPFWPETRLGRFAGAVYKASSDATDSYNERETIRKCSVGLIGLADDMGVEMNGGRAGARDGPNALRAALSKYGVAMRMDETDETVFPHVFDFGNIIPADDLHETHQRVTEAAGWILDFGLFPVGIGGGHDLTFPFVRAVASRTGGAMHGVYFDAHLDVRDADGSGMPFRRLIETCGVQRLTCVGLDRFANTREHFDWFREHGGETPNLSPQDWPAQDGRCPGGQFVSIDLDVLDASCAPGVSALNPAGMDTARLCGHAHRAGVAAAAGEVRCFDIMELNPVYDVDGRTARVAARLLLEFLRGMAEEARKEAS